LLRKLGIRAARRFLAAHYENVGVRSSIDLRAELAAIYAPAQDTFGRTVVFTPLKSLHRERQRVNCCRPRGEGGD
jgi:hypothetical protein